MKWIDGPLDIGPTTPTPLAWLTSLERREVKALAASASLTPADYADFAGRSDAAQRLARRRLVKALLAGLTQQHPDDVLIGRSALGAPYVSQPPGWHVSLSARWPNLAIAVASEPVGVDLEHLDEVAPPDDAFSAEELANLATSPHSALALWTVKEAHAKRTGRASLYDPRDIAIRADQGGHVARCSRQTSRCLTIQTGKLVATLAVSEHSE